ncbi:hypothetical protein Tco_1557359 [Tanacetum coccineum]
MVEKSKLDEDPQGKVVDPTSFADADHTSCQDTKKSTSESMQLLGDRLVSWSLKKQKSTAINSKKLNTLPCQDVVLKYFGCDHN